MSQVATVPSTTPSSKALRRSPPTARVQAHVLVSARLHLQELPRTAQLVERLGGEISEVSLGEPVACGTIDDRPQRGMHCVGGPCGAQYGGCCIDELSVEVDGRNAYLFCAPTEPEAPCAIAELPSV